MSSTKEYRDYVLDQLESLKEITYKPMMGEYLLYFKDILIGGIYDDRLLLKETKSNIKYNLEKVIPYQNAKSMFYIKAVDDANYLKGIILRTYNELATTKKRRRNYNNP